MEFEEEELRRPKRRSKFSSRRWFDDDGIDEVVREFEEMMSGVSNSIHFQSVSS